MCLFQLWVIKDFAAFYNFCYVFFWIFFLVFWYLFEFSPLPILKRNIGYFIIYQSLHYFSIPVTLLFEAASYLIIVPFKFCSWHDTELSYASNIFYWSCMLNHEKMLNRKADLAKVRMLYMLSSKLHLHYFAFAI